MNKKAIIASCCALPLLFASASAYSAESDGFYVGANLGITMISDSDITDTSDPGYIGEISYDNGLALSAAVGYRFGNMRVEGEIPYQKSDFDEYSEAGRTGKLEGDVESLAFMVNGYYDFNNDSDFTPYILAGIGIAKIEVNDLALVGDEDPPENDDDSVFAYQLGAGIGYEVNENFTVDVEYRYFATSDPEFGTTEIEVDSHNFLVGIRYNF